MNNNISTASEWPQTQCKAAVLVGFPKLSLKRSICLFGLFCCFIHLSCCSGDYRIITEIYIVLEEIGGLSPGVMFKGPSLLWSAVNHWFLPSLSPISSQSASAAKHLDTLTVDKESKELSSLFSFLFSYITICINVYWGFIFAWLWGETSLISSSEYHQGSSRLTSGLAVTAVLWLAATSHQQQVIGPGGFRAGWCVWMARSYPIISNGAVAIEKRSEAYQLFLRLIPQHTCLAHLLLQRQTAAVIRPTSATRKR